MITHDQITKANEKINKIDFKGKGYAMVSERVKAFREICPSGVIETEILSLENGTVTMKATVKDEDGKILATGMAQEKEASSYINKTSFIENCETSAIGRALGFVGLGSDAISSADELANALNNQPDTKKSSKKQEKSDEQKNAEMAASVDPDLLPDPNRTPEYRAKRIKEEIAKKKQDEAKLLENAGVDDWTKLTDAKYVALLSWLMKKK